LNLKWKTELLSKDFYDLTSPKDRSMWLYLNELKYKLGWDDKDVSRFIDYIRNKSWRNEDEYLTEAYGLYRKMRSLLVKYSSIKRIRFK
jgi:hypothetical protein